MLTKNSFVGYEVEEPIDQLFIIKNFLDDNQVTILLNYIESLSEKDWQFEYYQGLKSFCIKKFGTDDVEKLLKEGKIEITENWKDKNTNLLTNHQTRSVCNVLNKKINFFLPDSLDFKGPGVVQRQYSGVPLVEHYDQYTDPSIVYAAIIYLNDDYLDGELFFSKKDFVIKPSAKSLIIFPGSEDFTHGVYAPGEGPLRYVLPSFISNKGFYDDGKYYV
jgi:hypothetical protein